MDETIKVINLQEHSEFYEDYDTVIKTDKELQIIKGDTITIIPLVNTQKIIMPVVGNVNFIEK